jgi:hypothetical protein
MLYNQPYGISDPDAPYINGNPSTGTMGSIPPAWAVEHDQREIVNVIKFAADMGYYDFMNMICQQPSSADLQQLLKAIFGIMNSTRLTTPKTYYVNTTIGDDNYTGLTPQAPFKTIQRAVYQSVVFNLNGFNVNINVADGVYGQVFLPPINGAGTVILTGNPAVPMNVRIHANTGAAVYGAGGPYYFNGFRFESDAPNIPGPSSAGQPGAGIWSVPGGQVVLYGTNEFGYCIDGHMIASAGSLAYMGIIRIAGNAAAHVAAGAGCWLYSTGAPFTQLVVTQAVNITYFAKAESSATNSLRYSSMSGQGMVTGTRYAAGSNGIIDSGGMAPTSVPGTIAGITNSGGQYV